MQSVGHSNYEFSGIFRRRPRYGCSSMNIAVRNWTLEWERIGLAGFGFAPWQCERWRLRYPGVLAAQAFSFVPLRLCLRMVTASLSCAKMKDLAPQFSSIYTRTTLTVMKEQAIKSFVRL